jgi:hypothetical protein
VHACSLLGLHEAVLDLFGRAEPHTRDAAAAAGDVREARAWLKRIADVYPDYSELPVLRKIIDVAKLKQTVAGFGRPKRSRRQR